MAPSKVRGTGVLLVNMREIFAFDLIAGQEMERAPLPERNPDSWLLDSGDLLFARQSLTLAGAGKVSLVAEVAEPTTFESHIIRVRLDPEVADSRFYYYFFRSAVGRSLMESIVEQVAAAGIRASDLARLTVPVPPLPEQQRIAKVLKAFDDLAARNRTLVADIRALAMAVFARAAADGEETTFGAVARLVRESAAPAALAAGTPYLGLEHFSTDGGGIGGVGDATGITSTKSRFKSGDVLYGKLRPYFRKHDRPGFEGVCSTEIWVLRPNPGFGGATVDALVSRPEFTDFAMLGSGGTRMPRADWKHVANMPVRVPTLDVRTMVEERLDYLWRARVALTQEVNEVEQSRDELLELLMTGRVRSREAEAVA